MRMEMRIFRCPGGVAASLFAVLGLMVPTALARPTVALTPASDNTIFSENGAQSNGAGSYIFVGKTNVGNTRRALVRFDLSTIPPGSTITAVSLTMNMSKTVAGSTPVSLHLANATWGEGTSDASGQEGTGAPATTNDATWTHRFYNTTTWSAAGGDFNPTPSATASVDGNGNYNWSSAAMLSNVQGWFGSPPANRGWFVLGLESGTKTAKRFGSRQNGDPSQRPTLSVTYTAPATTGRCCRADGSCLETTPEGCATLGGTFFGLGTTCVSCTCPGPTGACCFTNGTCTQVTNCRCINAGGTFKGAGTLCASTYCSPQLVPYQDPMPIPTVVTPTTVFTDHDYYAMSIVETSHTFHSQLPAGKVWGYNGMFPGPTFVAQRNRPVRVNWLNDLRNTGADEPPIPLRSTHYLPVDSCLHGMNPTDPRPRTVVHLHGGLTDPFSDGAPESAFPPGSSSGDYWYANRQRGATLWYHDHALGMTRLNVYMGLAGFYILHDPAEDALGLPSGEYDVGLCIQDRNLNANGTLRYTGVAAAQEEFFGDKMLVNGKVWPYHFVANGKYRFRLLNGCNSRTLTLSLVHTGGSFQVPWWQIGTDHGLLPAPVEIAPFGPGSITLQPGERADVVIDFQFVPGFTGVDLRNSAPAPYPGSAGVGVVPNVMRFVTGFVAGHTAPLPATLSTIDPLPESEAAAVKDFRLRIASQPLCGHETWLINDLLWEDVTDNVRIGTTEVWRFINQSAVTHPMHLHLASFQVLDRQAFVISGGVPVPTGPVIPPPPTEGGWKDTVQCPPNQITRVIAKFDDYAGLFPYHCHLLEHEDHEMMRQYRVLCDPVQFLGNTGDVEIDPGDTAHFVVVANGDALAFQWYKGAVALQDGTTAGGSVISGAQTDHLIVSNAQVGHGYSDESDCYRCVISNPCSSGAQSACISLRIFGVCVGDINGDTSVDTADLVIMLGSFGQSVPAGSNGDFDGNGVVTTADLVVFLGRFGQSCL